MSWTPATSIAPRAAHPSRMRVRATSDVCESRPGRELRESTDLPQSCRKGSDPVRKGFFSAIRPSLFLPLDSSEPLFQGPCTSIVCRSRRCDCRFPLAEISLFCTILVQCKSFRCNTSEPPRMCCKQRTCAISKSRRCNTYKKQGVGAVTGVGVSINPTFLNSLPPYFHSSFPRRRPFRRKLNHAVS